MNHSDRTHYPSSTEWKLLGELELPVDAGAENTIQVWIAERLAPLDLPPGFLSRVVHSVHESAMRYLRLEAELAFGHIHLSIHVPGRIFTKGRTWGCFHMERIQTKPPWVVASDHTIKFYLYVEGD